MNIVFDKTTKKVLAVFDNDIGSCPEQEVLRSMFPNEAHKLGLWTIDKQISANPIHLTVSVDKSGFPVALFKRKKRIYKSTKKEKKAFLDADAEKRKQVLLKSFPKAFVRSVNANLINIWLRSPCTKKNIKQALSSGSYFSDKELAPVQWWGPFLDAGGYANMNREIAWRLHNYHVATKIQICPTAPQITPNAHHSILQYTRLNLSRMKTYPKIWSFTPIPHEKTPGKDIFFTMMETETLHPQFVSICNQYADEVWVPSNHNKCVFKNSGVAKRIEVMPLGIDKALYGDCGIDTGVMPGGLKSGLIGLTGQPPSKGIKNFKFVSLFGWSYRKGVDILIKSFVEEFTNKDDVALIIVSRYAGSSGTQQMAVIQRETEKYANMARKRNHPQILLFPHVIPEHQMPQVYKMGHAFVHTSRGEGFSLPQIEASACGLPVISCNNTGMSEYLRDDNAFLIKTNEKEMCSPEMHWITSYYHGQLFPKLGRKQILQTRQHMRYVSENYSTALERGKVLRQDVFNKYTWDHASLKIAKRLRKICMVD